MLESNDYVEFLRRWWWLVAVGVLIALAVTRQSMAQQPPLYSATATIQIGRAIQERDPSTNQFNITEQLVPVYAELARREQVLGAAAKELGPPLTAASLRSRLVVAPVARTPLIDIRVVDTDPRRAATIANEVARQVMLQSPANEGQDGETQQFIRTQIADLQGKITRGQAAAADLDNQIAAMISATDIYDAQQRGAALQSQIEGWQRSYAQLVTALEPSTTNLITIVQTAQPSSAPLGRSNTLSYALAAAMGAGLSLLLAIVVQFLTRAVRSARDLEGLPARSSLLTLPRYATRRLKGPVTAARPLSPAAAAYRQVRNALQANGVGDAAVLAVTSSFAGEGKTTTAVNLALAFANSGRRVLLVDANLHNPGVERWFDVASSPGFSDLLLGDATTEDVIHQLAHPNLAVVAAGSIPHDYADILSRGTVSAAVAALARQADLVLFDSPALLEEQETLLLARYASGVILLVEADRARRSDVERSIALLRQTDAAIVAIVLNKLRETRLDRSALPWSRAAKARARAAQRRQAQPIPTARLSGD